jgi:hypothetical protein
MHFFKVLATSSARNDNSGTDNLNGVSETDTYYGDEDDMISSSKQGPASTSTIFLKRSKHLRYRTRIFAAEYSLPPSLLFVFCVCKCIRRNGHIKRRNPPTK